ncbi:MAG: pentapeptide repeat-containing protein [Cyanobacteria bacterium J06614_10]
MTNHLALLEQGIERWNQWRASHPDAPCSLEGQDLSHGYFFEGDFRNVNLRGANLQRACLVGADFRGADLSNADLSGAYLGDANLHGANLLNTDLSKAKLERADMRRANLIGTRLEEADIRTTHLPDTAAAPYTETVAYLLWQQQQHTNPEALPAAQAQPTSPDSDQRSAQKAPQQKRHTDKRLLSRPPLAMPFLKASLQDSAYRLFRIGQKTDQKNNATSAPAKTSREQSIRQSAFPMLSKADQPWGRRERDRRLPSLIANRFARQASWLPAVTAAAIALAIGLPFITPNPIDPQQVAAQSGISLALAKSLTGTSQVWAVATHTQADGTPIVIGGGSEGQIEIWDGHTGRTMLTLVGHADGVRTLAVSESGQWLVSGSSDGINVWRPETGELVHHIPLFGSAVEALAIAPDENTFISSDRDGNITAWDLAQGEQRYSIASDSIVWSIAIAPDSASFVTGSGDQAIRQWDLATGAPLKTFTGHSDDVRTVAISPNGKTLASGSSDETIKLWDIASGTLQKTLTSPGDRILSLAISPDSKTLASSGSDRSLKLWDLSSHQVAKTAKTLDENVDVVVALTFDPVNPTLISGGRGQTVRIWQ